MNRALVSLLVLLLLSVVSCTTNRLPQGEDFSLERAAYVAVGMQDSEVLNLMEQVPYDRLSVGGGVETWIWVYSVDDTTKTFTVQMDNGSVTATNIRVE